MDKKPQKELTLKILILYPLKRFTFIKTLDIGVNIERNHKTKKLAYSLWNISTYNLLGRKNPYSIYFVTRNGETKAYRISIFTMPIPIILNFN